MINDFLDFCHKNDGRQINKLVSSRKKWKEVEDELLLKGIRKYGNQWSKIQEEVPTKDSKQCQARWKILKNKEETMDRLEALGDYSEIENQNHKIKKVKTLQREIPRRYNPHFDYNEESSSESMHLQQFQNALIKQPNQLSLLQQQHKKEQIQKQAQSQYQNVWNAMDDKMLWAAFKIYKGVWKQITSRFQEKNPQSCMERYQYLLQQKRMKLQEDGSSVDIISSITEDSSKLGSEQFDISISEGAFSTDLQQTEYKIISIGVFTVQQCHTNIERILKSFSNHNLDTLPGIRESIVKLIITD